MVNVEVEEQLNVDGTVGDDEQLNGDGTVGDEEQLSERHIEVVEDYNVNLCF